MACPMLGRNSSSPASKPIASEKGKPINVPVTAMMVATTSARVSWPRKKEAQIRLISARRWMKSWR